MTSAPDKDRDDTGETGTQLDIITAATEAAANMGVVYARESTPEDTATSLQQLLTQTQDELGYEVADGYLDDISQHPVEYPDAPSAKGLKPENGYDGIAIIYDVTEGDTSGVDRLIEFINDRDVDDVVARSLGEFGGVDAGTRVVERLQNAGVATHLVEDDLTVTPDDDRMRAAFTAARRAIRVDTGDASQLVTEATGTSVKWEGGQPPRGLTVNDHGYLERGDDWETVRRAAAAVEDGGMTEYRASKVTGISRHAIRTAKNEYRDIYRVDEADPLTIDDVGDEQ